MDFSTWAEHQLEEQLGKEKLTPWQAIQIGLDLAQNLAAELNHARRDAQIVGGDHDLRDRPRCGRAAVHVFDHRAAVEVGEHLAGESRRRVSGGDDGDDGERRNRVDP